MTHDFLIPVTVMMPTSMLGRIQGVARHHEVDPGPLIVELVRRQLILGGTIGATTASARAHRGGTRSNPARAHRWDPALDDQVRELHAEGFSDNRIGKTLGYAPGTIAAQRTRLGLPRLYTSFNPTLQRPDPITAALAGEVLADAS